MGQISPNLTELLVSYGQGNAQVMDRLLPMVYDELRRLARGYLRREAANHTLQATALVHEAYFKLVDQKVARWQNRAHFFGIAAQLMRRILIDYARVRLAAKRGGHQVEITFDERLHGPRDSGPDVLALDLALERLAKCDERQAKIVELRYFGGLSIDEVAEVLKTSPATVKRDWTMAKAWLHRELNETTRTYA
jgi:RNA polymerase sigma-70 factor, ECF subfamily